MEKLKGNYPSRSPSETNKLAKRFAGQLSGGEVVAFYGELGSGKTTFIQGMALALGIRERVISPTFVLIRRYQVKLKGDRMAIQWFYHLDLYRAAGQNIVQELALDDIWGRKEVVAAIEWADRLQNRLPKPRVEIHCQALGERERLYQIKRVS